MCVEMTVSPLAVYILRDGAVVTVNDVRMIFSAKPEFMDGVYFTTADSDMPAYEAALSALISEAETEDEKETLKRYAPECLYPDYIKHVRPNTNGPSLLTRDEFAQLFKTGDYVIS